MRAAPLAFFLCACAHSAYGPSANERLSDAVNDPVSSEDHGAIQSCNDQQESVSRARNVDRTENDRLRAYMEVVRALTDRVDQNQKLIDRVPEIAYAGGTAAAAANEARATAEACRAMLADARRNFEDFLRDLFSPLLIPEAGGKRRVARINLPLLRSAVEELHPTDIDALNEKISDAERTLRAQHSGG
jgi:hypothetical protein